MKARIRRGNGQGTRTKDCIHDVVCGTDGRFEIVGERHLEVFELLRQTLRTFQQAEQRLTRQWMMRNKRDEKSM